MYGIVHLNLLETLNLYYNQISSLQDILALRKLQNLIELDLRLNPVVKKEPFYRLYLVYAISTLRKLDDCAVRDRERKAALMHFSVESAYEASQKPTLFTEEKRNRSLNPILGKGVVKVGICEKPMELLLNLVEEYWCGKNKGHDPKHFLVHAVRILRTMEQEAANGEEERKALRERIRVLRSRAEKQETCHQSEIQSLSEQLQKAHSSI
ncbi:hypothetical protein P4O66_000046 [Electrophorus voltai]|uniref:Uncharacterized protein n=1 Tax=Electrophorus voltai TaxID=2609070 RepID=A0AAD8ZVP4_9TELE|nr:hypothetical protein P4O66_000046 [Electrophorus voltai]